jgi:hypothetical protein
MGDVTISVDADLQDDLGVMREMLLAHRDGADIVYGVRSSRTTDSSMKRVTAEGYYRLLSALGVDVVFNHADYRLLSRRAINALQEYQEVNLFLRGIVPKLGFEARRVHYARAKRFAGETKYPLRKMVALAIDGVTSFTAFPLRLISYAGVAVFLGSFLFGAWAIGVRIFSDSAVPGWASTVVPIYFLGGVQLLSLGVIGEYLSKAYMETKRRPRFHIESVV